MRFWPSSWEMLRIETISKNCIFYISLTIPINILHPSLWHSIPMIQMSLLLYAEHLYDRKLPSSRFSVHWSVRRSQLTTFILLNPFSNDHIYVNLIFNDLLVDLLSAALAVLSCCWSSRLRTSTTWSSPSSPSSPSSMLAFSNIVVVYNWEQQIGDRFN